MKPVLRILKTGIAIAATAISFGFVATPVVFAQDAEAPVQTTATFGNWTVRCRAVAESEEELCEIIQMLSASGGQGAVANIAVGKLPGDQDKRFVVQLPLGVYLPAGLAAKIGDTALEADFETCFPNFCVARANFDEVSANAFADGEEMTLTFKDRAQRDITLPVSLNGFKAAYSSVFH